MISIDRLRERDGSPFLGEATYEAFWVACSLSVVPPGTRTEHVPFSQLKEEAQWAWHAAGTAAVAEVGA